jgi:hypothetical protein
MPIRFRCVYCNQLLGISRRKAGTIVRCTSCEGQLIVPDPNEGATEPAPKGPEVQPTAVRQDQPAPNPDLFEQGDFDALLEPYRAGNGPAAVASPPKPPSSRLKGSASPSPAPSGVSSATSLTGLVLSRAQLTVISVVLVLTLGLAFAGGLLLGLSLRGG